MLPTISNIWIALLSDLLSVIIALLFIHTQFKRHNGNRILFVGCLILYYLLVAYCHLRLSIPLAILVVNVLFVFLITLFFDGTFQKRILCTVFTYVLLAMIELAGMTIAAFFTNVLGPFQYAVIKLIVIKGAALVMIQLYVLVRKKNIVSNKIRFRTWIKLFSVPVLSLCTILLFALVIEAPAIIILVFISITLVINFLVFMLYSELSMFYSQEIKMQHIKEQIEYYTHYLEEIMNHQDTLAIFQHDIKNRLIAVNSYLEIGEIEQAQKSIQALGDVRVSPQNFANTGIIEIDSIINDKLTKADDCGTEVVLKATVPKGIQVDPNDMAVILGNILDNAIEALAEVMPSSRYLEISINYDRGSLTILMKNSCVSDRKKSDSGAYFTTKKDTMRHGYGLSSIETIADKYNGLVKCFEEEGTFVTQVILFDRC